MRVNVYAEEMTDKVELIEKKTKDGTFVGVRFWLELPVTVDQPELPKHVRGPFIHHPGDDDSAAVTFWGKKQLKVALKKALDLLERHDAPACPTNTQAPSPVREDLRRATFIVAANPLIQWLNDHAGHPHHSVIVTPTGAELVEGQIGHKTMQFVKD